MLKGGMKLDELKKNLNDAIHDFMVKVCEGMFCDIFEDANAAAGDIGSQVALTPSAWNGSIFSMIQNLSNNVVIPIAGLIITYVVCYELITMIIEKNSMHDFETFTLFKWSFKAGAAVYLLSHTFEITMAIFDVGQYVVNNAAASITNDTYVDINDVFHKLEHTIQGMDTGALVVLMLEGAVVGLAVKAISILVMVVLTNRMIEIYMYCSAAPIPFATMTNREWGNIGTNYIRSIFALAFQGFFIMILVGVYSTLVKNITTVTDLHGMLMKIGGYSLVLCLTLFKTSSISKSIFNAR